MVECYRKDSDPQHLPQAKKCSFPKILPAKVFAIYRKSFTVPVSILLSAKTHLMRKFS